MKSKRHRISSDFVLAISSLLIAFVIWLIAAEADIETDNISVPIELINMPGNYKIEVAPRETIITVQYPKAQKSSIIPPNFSVIIDIDNIPEFDRRETEISTSWLLNALDVKKINVSERVKIIEIVQPKRVTLRARMFVETADIEPVLEGTLKEGYRLAEPPRARPSRIKITGPPTALDLLKEQNNGRIVLKTDPINISGESGSFFRTTKLNLPDQISLVNPEDTPYIEVIVGVSEIEQTRILTDVPIEVKTFSQNIRVSYTPRTATIEIRAPQSIVTKLSEQDFVCEPIQPIEETAFKGSVAIQAKFRESVSARTQEQTTILSIEPEAIDVTVTTASQN